MGPVFNPRSPSLHSTSVMHERDAQTDRRTDGHLAVAYTALYICITKYVAFVMEFAFTPSALEFMHPVVVGGTR